MAASAGASRQSAQGVRDNPGRHLIHHQPQVQSQNHRRGGPSQHPDPGAIGEGAHAAAVVGEADQRNHGEGKLHADDGLAQQQQPQRGSIAGDADGDHGGNDGQACG